MKMTPSLHFGLKMNKLPVIIQAEAAECALACLSMVSGYYHKPIKLDILRQQAGVSQNGMTLGGVINVARQLGFTTRSLRLEVSELNKLKLPCILHWDLSHFVVLKKVTGRKCVIHDPMVGVRTLPLAEVSRSFTGIALELLPDIHFQTQKKPPRVKLSELIGRIYGLGSSVIYVVILALAIEFLSLLTPLFSQWIIDDVIVSSDRRLLTILLIGYALTILFQQTMSAIRAWVMMHITTSLSLQWQSSVFRHLLRLPTTFFERRHLGDIVSRFTSVDSIQSTLSSAFFVAILDGCMCLITMIMMFMYSPLLAIIPVVVVLLYLVSRFAWYYPLRNVSQEQIIHAAKQNSHFLETMRGIKTIKLFQREQERAHDWVTLLVNQLNANVRTQKMQIFYQQLNSFLFSVDALLVLGIGASLVMDQIFTVGLLMAFVSYKDQFCSRIRNLIDNAFALRMLSIQTERLADIVHTAPEPINEASIQQGALNKHVPEITFKNVCFSYSPQDPQVIHDVSFTIRPGECVALAGPSGCGKTTLGQLAIGSLAATEGELLINGASLEKFGLASFRAMTAAVLQDDTLFAGTILENITFFDSQFDMDFVVECTNIAAIHTDIQQMPMQYSTLVGDMGAALSGGQKQRLLLARALYRKPRFLLLDEATSHLDVVLEKDVSAALHQLDMTRLIIAHRPQTLAMVDRVITIRQGRVVEEHLPRRCLPGVEE